MLHYQILKFEPNVKVYNFHLTYFKNLQNIPQTKCIVNFKILSITQILHYIKDCGESIFFLFLKKKNIEEKNWSVTLQIILVNKSFTHWSFCCRKIFIFIIFL